MDVAAILRDQVWVGISAIATAAAVVVALATVISDQRSRSAEAEKAQARRIVAWVNDVSDDEKGPTVAVLRNSSDEPVYRLLAWLAYYPGPTSEILARGGHNNSTPSPYLIVPPGNFQIELPPFVHGMHKRPLVEIAFTDAAGRHWIRRQNGSLERIGKSAVEHYGFSEPLDWSALI
jgi:hypothetical protein